MNSSIKTGLHEANALLVSGNLKDGRRRGEELLAQAVRGNLASEELDALLLLAQCDLRSANFRLALTTCQRAASLARELGDTAREAAAQMRASYVASALGRNQDAVEAALFAVHLARQHGDAPVPAALNSLGIACMWAGHFREANETFREAMDEAVRQGLRVFGVTVAINQVYVEAYRLMHARFDGDPAPSVDDFAARVHELAQLHRSVRSDPAVEPAAVRLVELAQCMAPCLSGQPGSVLAALERLAPSRSEAPVEPPTWIDALVLWGLAECQRALGHASACEETLARMMSIASKVQHEQLVGLAHMLTCDLHEHTGDAARALRQLRAWRAHAAGIHAETLEARQDIVRLQIEARERARQLLETQAIARRFEHLASHDPLTGIANRRLFEAEAERALGDASADTASIHLAFIDVDRFKAINDSHSHEIGDRVLQSLARLLSQDRRDADLVARLAGDEFAVLFRGASDTQVADWTIRLAQSVREFDWHAIAPGLAVGVSVGTATAGRHDTLAAVLSRADAAMYRRKRDGAAQGPAIAG